MINFDSYYDAPDFDDDLENTMEALIDVAELYQLGDGSCYDEEYRKESLLFESIASFLIENERLLDEFISHYKWVKAGRPAKVNVYEENADLYEGA